MIKVKNPIIINSVALVVIFMAVCSCQQNGGGAAKPIPGVVIATDKMQLASDDLNKFDFTITVKADSNVEQGVYDVAAVWGPSHGESKFTMPKGGEDLIPILRRSKKPNAFIIGFKAGKDTTFNEYFEVSGDKGGIKMMYVKAYSLE